MHSLTLKDICDIIHSILLFGAKMKKNVPETEKKEKSKFRQCLELFLIFLKIGAFTFGGGYAMISIIEHEITEKRKLLAKEDIMDIVAIAESTPGPIAINSATFVGKKTVGFWGAFCATTGVVLPSFVIMIIVASIYKIFSSLTVIRYAFYGIRAGVLALIIKALLSLRKACPKNVIAYIIIALSLIAVAFFKISAVIVILACALLGLGSYLICRRLEKK